MEEIEKFLLVLSEWNSDPGSWHRNKISVLYDIQRIWLELSQTEFSLWAVIDAQRRLLLNATCDYQ
jgi:hypothetical protein